MRYPCLVPKRLCKTDITCSFEREGLNEYGEPLKAIEYSGKCNYQDKARTVLTAEKKLIQITGTALFRADRRSTSYGSCASTGISTRYR